MDDELKNTLRYLRLWGLLAHWDEYVGLAQRQRFSPVRLLRHVLRIRNLLLGPSFFLFQPSIISPHIRQRHRHMIFVILIVLIRQPTNRGMGF